MNREKEILPSNSFLYLFFIFYFHFLLSLLEKRVNDRGTAKSSGKKIEDTVHAIGDR